MKNSISSGYVRGGANANPNWFDRFAAGFSGAPIEPLPKPLPIDVRASPAAPATMGLGVTKAERAAARGQGYTGDQCDNCQSMRMKISGHCMVCEDCGTTTGCS